MLISSILIMISMDNRISSHEFFMTIIGSRDHLPTLLIRKLRQILANLRFQCLSFSPNATLFTAVLASRKPGHATQVPLYIMWQVSQTAIEVINQKLKLYKPFHVMSSLPREFQRNLEHPPKRSDQSQTDDIQSDSYPITKKDEVDYFLEILYIKFNPLNHASRHYKKMRIWAQPVLVPLITLSNFIEYKHLQKSLNQSSRNVKLLDCITLTRN